MEKPLNLIGFILHNPGVLGRFRNLRVNTFEPYTTGEFMNYPEHWTPVYAYANGQMQKYYVPKAKKQKVYISGQITGLTFDQAKQKFDNAELDAVKRLGKEIEIINPMKLQHKFDATWEDYMEKDIAELLKCDCIYMINNWQESKGARCEHALAIELGLFVIYEEKYKK